MHHTNTRTVLSVVSEMQTLLPICMERYVSAFSTHIQTAYRTRTFTTSPYRASVPYFLAKIVAYCTVLT